MKLFHRVRVWFRRDELDTELSDELAFHLEKQIEQNLAAGMSPEEARYAALRSFGGVEQVKEECREAWGVRFIDTLLQDVRFGLRMLARNPGFTAVAVLALALGIGATTAVFSVVDRVLFRSLPYPDAGRLVSLGWTAPLDPHEFMLSYDYVDWRASQTPFESMTSWKGVADCDLTEQNPVRMVCAQVESNFLNTFGIHPFLGRNFTPEENRPNAPKVALLSHGLWKSRFGGDSGVVGKTISLDGRPTQVIGVLPVDFEFPSLDSANVLVPEVFSDAELSSRHETAVLIYAFARLKLGITAVQAREALEPLFQRSLQGVSPQFRKDVHLRVQPLRERQVHDSKLAAWILLAAVFAVLMIACGNVANMLLARAASRQREVAMRVALGAGRVRLIRQQLTESILLGTMGGAMGCNLAGLMVRAFLAIAPEGIPRLQQATLDLRVLVFTLGVSLVSGAVFGLAPALHLPSGDALTGRQVVAERRTWFRQFLVAAQVAISVVLLAGASLLLRSLWKLQNDPLGVESSQVVIARLVLGQQRYPQPAQRAAFFDQVEQRLRTLPGVTALALSDSLPPGGPVSTLIYGTIQVRGRERYMKGSGGPVVYRTVTPGYFSALHIPIMRGRGFNEQDREPNAHSIILSQSLAKRLFGSRDALSQQLQPASIGPWYSVVGVAADVKNDGLAAAPGPEFYVARTRSPEQAKRASSVLVRTAAAVGPTAQALRSAIASIDPTLPVAIETMEQRVGKLAQRPRFNAALLSLFAGIGLLLAVVGIYGVVSFLVSQRTQEIGLRMALGATSGEILRLVSGRSMRPVLIGAGFGIAGAVVASRLLTSLLFEVRPDDPVTFASVVMLLALTSLLATYLPARRATKVDPMVALRCE